ncbi:hypothetical protein RRG08_037691 [Elysia crispata]|uniref:Uncharacterized protein n=1 Tax=Elysia crispata TaxID=231223 RepID=A0AAE1A7Z6_9GAST|nr:hypothetical protein RRG08_037691 [Elysia crispata]
MGDSPIYLLIYSARTDSVVYCSMGPQTSTNRSYHISVNSNGAVQLKKKMMKSPYHDRVFHHAIVGGRGRRETEIRSYREKEWGEGAPCLLLAHSRVFAELCNKINYRLGSAHSGSWACFYRGTSTARLPIPHYKPATYGQVVRFGSRHGN